MRTHVTPTISTDHEQEWIISIKSYFAELDMVEVGNLGMVDVEACADAVDKVVDTQVDILFDVDMGALMASSLYRYKEL